MIINGMRPTLTKLNGKMLRKLFICLLFLMTLLTGCSEGRGDWKIELNNDYVIFCVNSNEIVVGYKKYPEQIGYSFAVENFFVAAYWTNDRYIGTKGIQTTELMASDKELENGKLCYYLIDTTNSDVSGPYDTEEEFLQACADLGIEVASEWIPTTNKVD